METGKKKTSLLLMIGALSLYFFHTLSSGANVAMADLLDRYSQYPTTTVTWVVTIVMIACIPTEIFGGAIVSKFGFKKTVIVGAIIALVSGTLPFFIDFELIPLIILRAVLGLAYGFLMPMAYSYITSFFEGDTRSRLLGMGQSVSGLSGMVVTILAGTLTAISLRHMYLYHIVAVIPLVFVFFLPEPEKIDSEEKKVFDFNLGGKAWFYCVMYGVAMLLHYAWPLYGPALIVQDGLGTAADAGYASTIGALGSLLGGIVYIFVKKICKDRTIGVSFLGMGIGYLIMIVMKSLFGFYAGGFVEGLFYFVFVSCCMDNLGFHVKGDKYTTAVGMCFVFACVASQVCVYVLAFTGHIANRVDDFWFYFLVTMIGLFVVGVATAIKPDKLNENAAAKD